MGSVIKLEIGTSLSKSIYQILRSEIVANIIPPNAKISEATLCEKFGVSRQPMREVLLRLSGDRLVVVHPQRGSFVSRISMQLFYNSQFIREAVETETIGRATVTSDSVLIDLLGAELELQEKYAVSGDTERFFQSDENFHRIIAGRCGLPTLWDDILDHKIHLDRVRHLSLLTADVIDNIIVQHRSIQKAIETRDPAAARSAMRTHLRKALQAIEQLRSAQPEWFTE